MKIKFSLVFPLLFVVAVVVLATSTAAAAAAKEGGGERSPYVFEDQHFSTIIETEHGRLRVLPRFTERSRLLKSVDNYRLLVLEAEPHTFLLPKYTDADIVFFVAQGIGSVSMVRQEKRESLNVKYGDIVVIPSGTSEYVINRSNNDKLVVVMLLRPVNTPGQFETYFGAGGEEPESFYKAFSDDILEAAFNIKRDKFQRIFGQQRQGAIVKASEEQIREMSHPEEAGIWPFGREHEGTANIFQQRSSKSNQYGQLFEVGGSQLLQLQDLDVSVTVANITQGSMTTLMYNSRATKIIFVSNGEGYLEMACPHLSQSQQGQRGGSEREEEIKGSPSYQKVSARLRRGVAMVIPAGHPFVAVASENQNVEVLCFSINVNNNERFLLAGKTNVINQFERQAKELAFGVSASEVDEVFKSQEDDFFLKGPSRREGEGTHKIL